jgi:hypothetical protein
MARSLLDKAHRLRQSDATWLCAVRRAHSWVMPKNRPSYRPYTVLVLEQETELIRRIYTQEEQPTPDAVLEMLLKAMLSPLLGPLLSPLVGFGKRVRPASILLDDADLVQALAPRLSEIDIRCDYSPALPLVDASVREIGARMTKREPIPGLLSVPGATEPLVRELFAAAADYYRQAPWRWMNNSFPIEARYPPDGRTRYAVVLGSGGEFFGLSLYETTEDLRLMYSGAEAGQIPSFSLVLEEATAMAFDDLDAMEKYGWPVAGERAYPLAIKKPSTGAWGVPSASEIAWLAATLRVIPDFVVRHLHADRGLPRPAEATYPLPDVHGSQKIALRYPINLLEPEAQEEEEQELELEEYIQDWYWDEQSHEFARQVGKLLFQFMDHLERTGLSERTIRKHINNCWVIGWLECGYGYHDTFSPEIFLRQPSFTIEFKRKVSDSKYAVASYKTTWRKLARYVRSLGYGE